MACCDWETFSCAFLAAWQKSKFKPSELLIDWKRAKRDWKRYHCTGMEAATMQPREILKEEDYLWLSIGKKNNRGGGGGVAVKRTPEFI